MKWLEFINAAEACGITSDAEILALGSKGEDALYEPRIRGHSIGGYSSLAPTSRPRSTSTIGAVQHPPGDVISYRKAFALAFLREEGYGTLKVASGLGGRDAQRWHRSSTQLHKQRAYF